MTDRQNRKNELSPTKSLAFLAEASRILSSSLDIETTLAALVHLIVPFLADWSTIELLDDQGRSRQIAVAHSDPAREADLPAFRLYNPSTSEDTDRIWPENLATVFRPVITADDLAAFTTDADTADLLKYLGFRSYICLPLSIRGRTLGSLALVLAGSGRQYTRNDFTLAEDLAHRIASAVDNAQLYRQAQQALQERDRALAEAELLNAIAIAASGEHDLKRILAAALDRLSGLIHFTGGSIAIIEGNELVVHAASGPFTGTALGQRLPRGTGRSWQIINSGRPFLCNDLPAAGIKTQAVDGQKRMESYLATPLFWRDTVFGLLEVDSTEKNAFSEADLLLLQKASVAISGSIEVARRYAAEVKALAEAEAERKRLQDIFMHAPALISIFRGPEHICEFINPPAQQLLATRNLIGKPVREGLSELQGQGLLDLLDMVYRSGEAFIGNEISVQLYNSASKSLEEHYFNFVYQPSYDSDARVDGIIAYAIDVSEQVHARHRVEELALLLGQYADQLNAIIEAIPDGVYVADAQGTMTMINARGTEMLGVTLEQPNLPVDRYRALSEMRALDGKPVPDGDLPLSRALKGQTGTNYRMTIRQANTGELLDLQVSYAPIRDKQGAITGAVAVASDITELHRLERQKDEFLSVASHELKTPLTSIKGLTQMAIRRLARGGHSTEAASLKIVEEQINRLVALINDLLDVSRIQSGRLELEFAPFDFAALLRSSVMAMQATTDRHELRICSPEQLVVTGDANRIEQVLTNLIGNAIKYSPDGGLIEIKLEQMEGLAQLSVRDSGIGIPEQDRGRLFERFHRASNVGSHQISGFGIGLYICSEIIRAHHGQIWLDDSSSQAGQESEPASHGSCFYVRLPLGPDSGSTG